METTEELQALSRRVASFEECYRNKLDLWNRELDRLCEKGSRIVVWGAGSKGISFLNVVKAADEIRYVVDINPYKQKKYVVGTGQQIIAPEFLREYQPDTVVVLNPIYLDEIRHDLQRIGVPAKLVAV
jgi:C-methyltransferase C-terminal domain